MRQIVTVKGALLILAASLAVGCSDDLIKAVKADVQLATAPKEPAIEISRGSTIYTDGATCDFGRISTTSHADLTFSIKNTGTGDLLLGTPQVAPSNETDGFSVQNLSGTSVAAGSSVNLVVRFEPSSEAYYTAELAIPTNALNDSSVAFNLTGTGDAPDILGPTGTVSIDASATYTQDTDVTLTLSATDVGGGTVTMMEIRNDAAFTGDWITYNTSLSWTLPTGDGTKTVYVRFRDDSGNTSTVTISDSIILDTVNPTISSTTPSNGASNQPRTVNATVAFSESMDQTTLVDANVYLRIKGTTAHIPASITKTATSIILDPTANLLYGYDYQIVVTAGAKDLSGRSVAASTVGFTVERDYWEGPNGNDSTPYDLSSLNSRDIQGSWFDFVDDEQEEEWYFPVGVHSKLAQLEGVDYYTLDIPDDVSILELEVLFTSDETAGIDPDAAGTDSIKLYVNHGGYGQIPSTTHIDAANDRYYEYAVEAGTYTILIQESTYNYANRRSYNLRYCYSADM